MYKYDGIEVYDFETIDVSSGTRIRGEHNIPFVIYRFIDRNGSQYWRIFNDRSNKHPVFPEKHNRFPSLEQAITRMTEVAKPGSLSDDPDPLGYDF